VTEFVRGDLAAVARTRMSCPTGGPSVTLYPMFHVGSAGFYRALSEDFQRFRVFLLEGVPWPGFRRPLYDLAAHNLGLVPQHEALLIPRDAERIPLDMSPAEFAAQAAVLPVASRLMLLLLRPLLWATTATSASRSAAWRVFSKGSYVRGLRDPEGPLDQLIRTKRDRAMAASLRAFVEDPRRGADTQAAVVAGAMHMPALYATLRACGYLRGSVRWFEVLDGLTIPSAGTDGRATPSGGRT
jgi:hypothetical protein